MKHLSRKQSLGMDQDVDDARMGACGEDERALPFHANGDESLIEQQRVRLPGRAVIAQPVLSRQARLKRRDARNLTADQEEAVQDRLRFGPVLDTCSVGLERLRIGNVLEA